jgi:hypothetical protein
MTFSMSRFSPRVARGCIAAMLVAALVFLLFVHQFLAVNAPVAADVLVVEGWVPKYVADRAVSEFARGGYRHVFVSGLIGEGGGSDAAAMAGYLASRAVDPARLVAAPAPDTGWNRTSHMARAVRQRIDALGITPTAVNVITLGPHGRQSRLAYSRAFGPSVPVGVMTVPKDDYDPRWWWLSVAGIKKTTKDFAGWARELVFGLRS